MGYFDITKEVCDQISKMIARYWWSCQEKENKMHWISWKILTRSKGKGGLGVHDIQSYAGKAGLEIVRKPRIVVCTDSKGQVLSK